MKYVRDQIDRLQEISPLIPPEILAVFNAKFGDMKSIAKPEEANGLEGITIYPADTIKDAPTPSDSIVQSRREVRLQNLPVRNSIVAETSRPRQSDSTGGRSSESREDGGSSGLPTERLGHEEDDSHT